ncbi:MULTISPECIES: GntR family transcriptional regulator [unclassified Streptomyces]|uniref:GntR family transcriptional regulator n=1 Tax=unclassified Streptomyces TaxID=2593676 RepID=UPI000BAC622B|nr:MULTISPECIES: GntR family transcriptional regulator [unclassified Streptomyces]ASY37047.1 GntR family transcriptional regulator [Streptomyces sp. CLI2509]MYX23515.1 GntR family transcriptional regulator [Streptomyces sp. SID8380]
MPSYRDIAADLRQQISEGRYRAGDRLPMLTELQTQYGAGYQTVRSAIALLEQEGLVVAVRRRGTIVRERPEKRRITRSRQVFRDEIGYYFDPTAQPWAALEPPHVRWGTVPIDLAAPMGLSIGAEVLVRDRVMGDPSTRKPTQLATSYLPGTLARGTRLAEADTGPGGIYDRLEEMGYGPLRWSESFSARMPSPEEAEALHLPADVGVPLLRIMRLTTSPDGEVLELNDTRMSAEEFEIGYSIRRHPSARLAGTDVDEDEHEH